jgi:hypothetical protein
MRERRIDQRHFREISLERWLTKVVQQAGISRLVLTDNRGLLIASSSNDELVEYVAVAGRILADWELPESKDPRNAANSLVARKIETLDEPVFICAVGELERGREGVRMASQGVVRILEQGRMAA